MDGEPNACRDKSKILHHIEELRSLDEDRSDESNKVNKYKSSLLIIDGIAVLNQIYKVMETFKVVYHLFTVTAGGIVKRCNKQLTE